MLSGKGQHMDFVNLVTVGMYAQYLVIDGKIVGQYTENPHFTIRVYRVCGLVVMSSFLKTTQLKV